MMLEILGALVGNIFAGGATGILGVIAQRYADYKNKQLDMALEKQRADNAIALRRVDMEIMDREWRGRVEVATTEADASKDVAASQAFAASFHMEPQRYSEGTKLTPRQQWVMVGLDALRGAIRPLLTVYLCLLATLVWVQARNVLDGVGGGMNATAAMEVWKMVVGQILYLTTTCTLWWFGTRNKSQQP